MINDNKKYHESIINLLMLILFVITVYSLWGANWALSLIDNYSLKPNLSISQNNWIFLCWLPIPLLSIILGFKYKNRGFKCTKNIVAGFIVGFFLLINGLLYFFPTSFQDYSKISTYKNIIGANLPDYIKLEYKNLGTFTDKSNYTTIKVYYANEVVEKFEKSIANNPNWILSKEVKSELKPFLSSIFIINDDAYFSIYNKTTNQYNTLPEIAGEYEIYVMKYDKFYKCLEIHRFNY